MKINIKHIAQLASLPIPEAKESEIEKALETTIEHINSLQEVDTSKVAGTNEVTDLENIFREDVVLPSLTQEQALANAKNTHNGFFVVPAVLEEGMDN